MAPVAPQEAVVRVTYVHETPIQQKVGRVPLRRFEIQAAKTTDDPEGGRWNAHLSFATLDQFKASLCQQAWKQGLTLKVSYRSTGYWDSDLLTAELV